MVKLLVAEGVPDIAPELMLQGLEEEGIPAEAAACDDKALAALAYQAASSSRLLVGIGVSASAGKAALHHRDLPSDEPLLEVPLTASAEAVRRLGLNAARLVKGQPLELGEPSHGFNAIEPEPEKAANTVEATGVITPSPEVMALVERIMNEMPT